MSPVHPIRSQRTKANLPSIWSYKPWKPTSAHSPPLFSRWVLPPERRLPLIEDMIRVPQATGKDTRVSADVCMEWFRMTWSEVWFVDSQGLMYHVMYVWWHTHIMDANSAIWSKTLIHASLWAGNSAGWRGSGRCTSPRKMPACQVFFFDWNMFH